jgi:agmatinase
MAGVEHLYINPISERYHFLGFSRPMKETILAVVGAPLDLSTSYRGGCSDAPRALREASKSLELCTAFTNIDMERVGFHDLGDVVLAPGDVLESMSRIEQVVQEILTNEKRLLILGGEHTITLPSFKALANKFKRPCLIVFDAHGDLRQEYLGSKYNHATVVRRIVEEVPHRKIVIIGARALSREEAEYLKTVDSSKLEVVRILGKVSEKDMNNIVKAVEECRGVAKYISIDMDFLDPAYAPGVQTPEPLGATPLELLEILGRVIDGSVHVVDLVEVTPRYDPSEATVFLGAKIAVEVAGMILKHMSVEAVCW